MVDIEYCTRCSLDQSEEGRILRELAHAPSRSIEDINRQLYRYESIKEKAREQAEGRLGEREKRLEEYEQQLRQHEEELSFDAVDLLVRGEDASHIAERILADKVRRELEQAINSLKYQPEDIDYSDVEAALKEYEKRGYIDIQRGRVRITSRGARILAKQVLRRVIENLARKEIGAHPIKEVGYGSEVSTYSRRYELGDEYELVDIEKTLSNALERSGKLSLELEDFQVFDTVHQTRMCAGVIIDESGSMLSDKKVQAAIEASLALSELVGRDPKDSLKVFAFSEKVKRIPPWDIVNAVAGKGSTDMRAGLMTFRKAVMAEKGDKQAYLITDSEPNSEDGVYIGFEKAMEGVLREAMHYRENDITLNIIMLDQRPQLKEFARILAQKNLGRVIFASPHDLSAVIIEDYLMAKRRLA